MKMRLAKPADIKEIMDIVGQVQKKYFEKNDIPQWRDGYPQKELFEKDIEKKSLFVLSQGELIIGMAAVCFEHEPSYDIIENGAWKSDGEYAVIHRIAVSPDFHGFGFGKNFIELAQMLCNQRGVHSLRADTHEQNIAMQKTFQSCGMEYCGVIHIENGDPRVAYEKLI